MRTRRLPERRTSAREDPVSPEKNYMRKNCYTRPHETKEETDCANDIVHFVTVLLYIVVIF